MTQEIFFYIFASIAVGMIFLVILSNNPVASALSLVFSFFGLAGLYVLLDAPFVAVLQILVYAGAIMVLFVFVIMLLKLRPEDLIVDDVNVKKIIFIFLGAGFAYFIIGEFLKLPLLPFEPVTQSFGSPKEVGRLLFTKYLIPFEMISILLTVAVIGVVVLGKKEHRK